MISGAAVIRPARAGDAGGIARVEVETWRDAYPALLPAAYLVGRLDVGRAAAKWRARIAAAARRILVAAEGAPAATIVGYATWGGSRLRGATAAGEIYELYVLPAARERGIGGRLLRAAAVRMVEAGLNTMAVEVLEGNPARWFYHAQGGRLAARGRHDFAGKPLPTVVYAWDDLAALMRAETG